MEGVEGCISIIVGLLTLIYRAYLQPLSDEGVVQSAGRGSEHDFLVRERHKHQVHPFPMLVHASLMQSPVCCDTWPSRCYWTCAQRPL